jgi:DNA replication protein DnaC
VNRRRTSFRFQRRSAILIVVDEVGHIPFEPEAANLFFQFIPGRYERAPVIVTGNKPFGRWTRPSATTPSPRR